MLVPKPYRNRADTLVGAARNRGLTIACAESLTGGAVCAALVAVPGASEVVRGAVVAYQTDVKVSHLGVDRAALMTPGPVSEAVASAMATGVLSHLGADVGIATTGAAGPDPHGGRRPGIVCIAVAVDGAVHTRTLDIRGERDAVREGAVVAAINLANTVIESLPCLTGT